MAAEVCACGHLRARHLIRWSLPDTVRARVAEGFSACNDCQCAWYVHVATVEDEDRPNFRVRPKFKVGNFGTGHPLTVGVAKSETVTWEPLTCSGCGVALSSPQLALVLDSGIYCAPCFVTRPEVYLGSL